MRGFFVPAVASAAALVVFPASGAGQAASRIVDLRSKWLRLPGASTSASNGAFAWVAAGAPLAPEPGRQDSLVRLSVDTRCAPRRVAVPLSPRGLEGGAAGQLGDDYDCMVPSRVHVRIRAFFVRPTRLRRYGVPGRTWTARVAEGTIERAWLAVRTVTGRPVAYADMHQSGRARLFVARSCLPK